MPDGTAIASWPNGARSGATVAQSNATYRPVYRVVSGVPLVRNATNGGFDVAFPTAFSTGEITFVAVANTPSSTSATGYILTSGASQTKFSVEQASSEFGGRQNGSDLSGSLMPQTSAVLSYAGSASGTGFTEGPGRWLYVNGNRVFRQQNSNAETWADNTGITSAFLGGIGAGQGSAFTGDLRRVLLWNRRLTESEHAQVALALAQAYNVTLSAPSQVFAQDGDSLTVGLGTVTSWTDMVLQTLAPAYRSYNFGVSGQTIVQMASDAATQIDPLRQPSFTRNVLTAWGGTNDMNASPGTSATVIANYASYCTARRAAGWKVIAFTCLPRGAVAQFETDRQAFNTSVRANWATYADALCDVGGNATIGAAGAQNNATYYNVDAIHLTAAGHQIVAGLVTTALSGL